MPIQRRNSGSSAPASQPVHGRPRWPALLLPLLLILLVALPAVPLQAEPAAPEAALRRVVINEIAWMGSTASANAEWIELRHTGKTKGAISLNGWTLTAADGSPNIALSGLIPAKGHFLLERINDDAVPGVAADLIYTGALSNDGETLILRDEAGLLVDAVDGWYAGDLASHATMQRVALDWPGTWPTSWQTGPSDGLPENSAGQVPDFGAVSITPYFTDNIAAGGPSPEPTAMEQALLTLLNSASDSIDTAMYGMDRASVRDALIAAHQRGVIVRLVCDDDAYTEASYRPHFQALEAAGIWVIPDGKPGIMHNKFFIVDKRWVWTGSTNATDTDFSYNHNHSVLIDSPHLALTYQAEFSEMFYGQRFGKDKEDNTTHFFRFADQQVKSAFSPTDKPDETLLATVAAAQESIRFAIFSFTSSKLADVLLERYQAGVEVAGLWDQLMAASGYSQSRPLCRAGVPTKVENFGGKLHHKMMVIDADGDDPRVVLGSYNWTSSATDQNDENLLIVHSRPLAQAFLAEWHKLDAALGEETVCHPTHVYLPAVLAGR
ncbi:MAG: phospholipase D-like domain-containing protein [Anaerolineae bacterium]|nr:phospholipase D-like domain-containing protein [Anaerolineae bacterium]